MRTSKRALQHIQIHRAILILNTLTRQSKINQHHLTLHIRTSRIPIPTLIRTSQDQITRRQIPMHHPSLMQCPNSSPNASQQPLDFLLLFLNLIILFLDFPINLPLRPHTRTRPSTRLDIPLPPLNHNPYHTSLDPFHEDPGSVASHIIIISLTPIIVVLVVDIPVHRQHRRNIHPLAHKTHQAPRFLEDASTRQSPVEDRVAVGLCRADF